MICAFVVSEPAPEVGSCAEDARGRRAKPPRNAKKRGMRTECCVLCKDILLESRMMSLHRTQHSVRIPRFFAFLGGLALLPLASSAQDPTSGAGSETTNAQIIVFVREATGEPLKNQAVVRLFQSNGTPRGYASTSSGGETVFSNLPLGDYYVEVTAAGYRTARGEAGLPIPVPTQGHIYLQPEPTRAGDATPPGSPILAPKAHKHLDKGLDALRADDLKEPQKHLEPASQLAPGHPNVLYFLDVLYTRIQDRPQAQSVLDKA